MRKIVFILGVVVMLFAGASSVFGGERSWVFQDSEFDDVRSNKTLTSEVTVNGLTLGKGIRCTSGVKTVRNVDFKGYILTSSDGNITEGYVKFYVNGNTDVHILAGLDSQNVKQETRTLTAYAEATKEKQRMYVNEIDDYVYRYRGGAGYIYLYTGDKYLRIFAITARDYDPNEYRELGEGEKREWDMSNYKDSIGTITSNTELDGLKIYANESRTMGINASTIYSPYGDVASCYVDMKGTGKYDGRYISFSVPKNSDIYVTARSGDGVSERKLIVRNAYYGISNTDLPRVMFDSITKSEDTYIEVNKDLNTYKMSYYGEGDELVLTSADSAIRIYKITIVPRSTKGVSSKTWNISSNSNFTTGTYSDAEIDGLRLINSNVVNTSVSGYSKAILIKSNVYNNAGKLRFNVSDSSQERGERVKRTITIKANTNINGTVLAVVNSAKYLIGSYALSTDVKEYKFEYDGNYDELTVYTYYDRNSATASSYIYSIDNGIAEISGPDDTERTISVTAGQEYQYYFTGDNIKPDNFVYKIKYNPSALKVKYVGYGDGKSNYSKDGISIIENNVTTGEIIYTIDKGYDKWSGVTVSVIFEAKSTGNTTISYIAEVREGE